MPIFLEPDWNNPKVRRMWGLEPMQYGYKDPAPTYTETRQLTDSEKRVLAAGLAHMQPQPSMFEDLDRDSGWAFLLWSTFLGLLGWLLIGLAVLGIVGLLGVFAV